MTTRNAQLIVASLASSLLLLAGCKSSSSAPSAGKTPFHQALVQKIEKAGLKVDTFEQAASRPYKAEACVRGAVEKLDVLLCRYPDEATGRKHDKALVTFVGTAISGAVRHVGAVGVVVADRDKVDLKGERINRLLKVLESPTS
jgi:hypothetical protein